MSIQARRKHGYTKAGLAIFALVTVLSLQAEVVHSKDSGFIVKNQYTVKAAPEVVWLALVDDVGQWWPSEHTWFGDSSNLSISTKAGGCFCEIDDERQVQHMVIGYVDPGKRLRMLGGLGPLQGMGGYGALDWVIDDKGDGTTVTLTYQVTLVMAEGMKELALIVDRVQRGQLGALINYINRISENPRAQD